MSETAALQGFLDTLSSRLSVVESKLGVETPAGATTTTTPAGPSEDAKSVKAFDAYCRDCLDPFVAACAALEAPEATTCGEIVTKGWMAMRSFLAMASACKKPAAMPQGVMEFVKPCQEAMQAGAANVQRGDWEFHEKTISEGLQCLSWLLVSPAPVDFIENFIGAQDFWANKIRVKHKTADKALKEKQVKFCDTFKKLMLELMPYVKEHHATGVAYNPKGVDVASFSGAATPAAPTAKGTPKPAAATSSSQGGGLGDLKAALSGGSVTSGLKKVTKDMQTWRAEYKAEGSKVVKAAPKSSKPAAAQKVTKGPPALEFQRRGMKWLVENQTKDEGVITVEMDPKDGVKHTVYICTCYEATIDIKGKCKGVAIDGCVKCNVLFDSAISSMEVVNSKSMKCQARGTVPSVAIDKTDGILTYLSRETLDITSFVTSKSSDMQISFPNDAGDMVEAPIPEQFVHKAKLVGDKAVVSSDVSDLYSH
ncbi:hypothetical protein CTAYLR_009143 [Chrysophaeum taylorii]|uniref:C-CAP/cofactor C-like domain-containing protein n=1 Tax=Chrysophaeum taylorii TaxID=2483200 RepID=A0AAD7UKU6_9STRA|nr:hypothetical protein CTAYLR_009143 [Chrysophaeum taylorii]